MTIISTPPNQTQIKEGSLPRELVDWFLQVWRICDALTSSGTTANRPTKYLWVGRMYYDTTLNKPIWVKTTSPVVWVDGVGTVS